MMENSLNGAVGLIFVLEHLLSSSVQSFFLSSSVSLSPSVSVTLSSLVSIYNSLFLCICLFSYSYISFFSQLMIGKFF
ncbi:hypothetical protein ES319_D05G270000v1 [Gossypium barbadense]|uniref:Uncharacterized protein n=2 Tax=Gossypium TaxID=3633 RepID=A0A0D2TSI0_GOSRA|nr:hypothetical protein ES319_D05G270000v1 [Gossypium barbadense]KJB59769.1 hypothetical protein B456_009G270700 [Gossypium raimondii]